MVLIAARLGCSPVDRYRAARQPDMTPDLIQTALGGVLTTLIYRLAKGIRLMRRLFSPDGVAALALRCLLAAAVLAAVAGCERVKGKNGNADHADSVATPPDTVVTPPPVDSLSVECRAAVDREGSYYNRRGQPWPHCAGEYPPRPGESKPPTEQPPVDTAIVPSPVPADTVIPPPPSTRACSNEPTNLPLVLAEDFSGPTPPVTDASQLPVNTWAIRTSGSRNVSFTGGQFVGKFPQGARGGAAPFSARFIFAPLTQRIYICVKRWIDPDFTSNGNSGIKWFFFHHPGTARINHYGNLYATSGVNVQHKRVTDANGVLWTSTNYCKNTPSIRGQWATYEYDIAFGTPGTPNATIDTYVNGQQRCHQTGVQWFSPLETPAVSIIAQEPTYGGGKNPVPKPFTLRLDDLRIRGN